MMAVGLPLYLTSGQDAKAAGDRQLASAFNSMNVGLRF
jgi:hypothetical protein